MTDDVVLVRRRDDHGAFRPDRELVFFDEPILPERLAQIRTVQVWAPHGDRLGRLPEVIGQMETSPRSRSAAAAQSLRW